MLVMDWRSWASQIVNRVDLHIERERDIVPDYLEMFVIEQVFNIAPSAGKEIIDTDRHCSIRQQALTQIRSKKAGAAGD